MERALSKFGVLEIARTGKISLKRGSALLQMGGWGDSATRRAHQARPTHRLALCTSMHCFSPSKDDLLALCDTYKRSGAVGTGWRRAAAGGRRGWRGRHGAGRVHG